MNYFEYMQDKARRAAQWDAVTPGRVTAAQREHAEFILSTRETELALDGDRVPHGWYNSERAR